MMHEIPGETGERCVPLPDLKVKPDVNLRPRQAFFREDEEWDQPS
jgi:hypothetical protein